MIDVHWDDRALEVYLTTAEEDLLPGIASDVADVARAMAPVRMRHTPVPRWAKHGYVGVPGRLKGSVAWYMGRDIVGPYADVGSLWYGRFLDPPAKQLHHMIPFLPTALYMVVDGRHYYL